MDPSSRYLGVPRSFDARSATGACLSRRGCVCLTESRIRRCRQPAFAAQLAGAALPGLQGLWTCTDCDAQRSASFESRIVASY